MKNINENKKKIWNKPEIRTELSIKETLGTNNPGNADTNAGGNRPRS
jgi:hypothetical protein